MRQTEGRFIEAYLSYIEDQESPEKFHIWVALSILSAMLGRKCWMDLGAYILFPNQYVLLCGASGKVKKDTAIDLGVALLQQCPVGPNFFPGRLTASALLGYLSRTSKVLKEAGKEDIHSDAAVYILGQEITAFLGPSEQAQDLMKLLTGLYKSPEKFVYLTRSYGEESLHNICLNMLAGTTLRWLKESMPAYAVQGGFTGRLVIVYSAQPRQRKAFPHLGRLDTLVNDLCAVRVLTGKMKLDPEAHEFMRAWYETQEEYEDNDPRGPYYERKFGHILKVAMALSAAGGDEMQVSKGHVERAKSYIEELEPDMKHALTTLSREPAVALTEKIFSIIKRHGTISRVTLLKRASKYMRKKQLDEILETLMGSYIRMDKVARKKGKHGGRPRVEYSMLDPDAEFD